jgi:hypothetical protein
MLDKVLDVVDVDWSRRFVCWRGWAVFVALTLLPAQTLAVVTQWEQHRLAPIVQKLQQIGETSVSRPAPRSSGHRVHDGARPRIRASK